MHASMLLMQTCTWKAHLKVLTLEHPDVCLFRSCKAPVDPQVFHFSESKDKEDSDVQDVNSHDAAAQDSALQEGSLPAHTPDKKIS